MKWDKMQMFVSRRIWTRHWDEKLCLLIYLPVKFEHSQHIRVCCRKMKTNLW